MLIAILMIVVAMACRDFLGTLLVVAEAKGRDRLAGLLDASGDVAQMVCMVVGVDSIKGIDHQSLSVLGAMALTSYHVTRRTTKLARRMKENKA